MPRGRVPELICEVLSEGVGRSVSLADIGMGGAWDTRPKTVTSADDGSRGGDVA